MTDKNPQKAGFSTTFLRLFTAFQQLIFTFKDTGDFITKKTPSKSFK